MRSIASRSAVCLAGVSLMPTGCSAARGRGATLASDSSRESAQFRRHDRSLACPPHRRHPGPSRRRPRPGRDRRVARGARCLTATHGPARARFLLDALLAHARRRGVNWQPSLDHAVREHHRARGAAAVSRRSRDRGAARRADALERARDGGARQPVERRYGELGGHIASYASAADLFEVGFNHFFRARDDAGRAARRPRVLPAALCAGRLCARLSRRPSRRRTTWPTTARS